MYSTDEQHDSPGKLGEEQHVMKPSYFKQSTQIINKLILQAEVCSLMNNYSLSPQ